MKALQFTCKSSFSVCIALHVLLAYAAQLYRKNSGMFSTCYIHMGNHVLDHLFPHYLGLLN